MLHSLATSARDRGYGHGVAFIAHQIWDYFVYWYKLVVAVLGHRGNHVHISKRKEKISLLFMDI
jgi:hypothetical protein